MPGYFFLGHPGKVLPSWFNPELKKIAGGHLKSYLLASQSPHYLIESENIHEITGDAGSAQGHGVALLLTESTAYGFFGRPCREGAYSGYHTTDWTIVSAMVTMLERSYSLQRTEI